MVVTTGRKNSDSVVLRPPASAATSATTPGLSPSGFAGTPSRGPLKGVGCSDCVPVSSSATIYPWVATRMTPVTITFAIASGSRTFQPSLMSMS